MQTAHPGVNICLAQETPLLRPSELATAQVLDILFKEFLYTQWDNDLLVLQMILQLGSYMPYTSVTARHHHSLGSVSRLVGYRGADIYFARIRLVYACQHSHKSSLAKCVSTNDSDYPTSSYLATRHMEFKGWK